MHKYEITETGRRPEKASGALILLHGRGATADDLLPLADVFTDGTWYVAAPQATNFQWYPYGFMEPLTRNEPWLGSAISLVQKLINDITLNIPAEKIYMMGFSQGACLISEVAARNAGKFGGIAVFTGGLIGEKIYRENYSGNFEGTPVYISNGDNDPHIPERRSVETKQQLLDMGAEVKLDIIPGRGHSISPEEVYSAKSFLAL